MPLYEYRCQDCEETFEVLQALGADADHLACPTCEGADVHKLLSTFAASTGAPRREAAPSGCCRGTPT